MLSSLKKKQLSSAFDMKTRWHRPEIIEKMGWSLSAIDDDNCQLFARRRVLVTMMYHSLSLFKWGLRTEKTLIFYVQLTE